MTCSRRKPYECDHRWRRTACGRPRATHFGRLGMDLRADPALRRGDLGDRPRVPPGHLSQPDRSHHLRADARRLCLGRAAHRLSALVVRQGVHPQRAVLPQGHAGPGVRDRHQFQPMYCLPDGGELHGDAGAGDRARLLRPQFLLQGQLPVPAMDRRRQHPRLPGLRAQVRDGLRRPLRHRGRRGDPGFLPCAGGAWRGPLQAAHPHLVP
ncbi:Uncharacterised protein [Bordetella pertussis]|nr:Uncharacterised protein [Bordetella pertussis]CFU02570.1 Uncharacterised protein [Bordetella pertussis]CFW04695.1 Uncharacterised protein [Bordetella pertussis]CFW42365.1 Uncharacterised protein [Bordetella pertussis]CPL26258.1 Uncharacterised protein [Bordetella pertussis]